MTTAPSPSPSSLARRHAFVRWLRTTHGWIGLWGAALGLLFGSTGIVLNHRNVLKIPAAQVTENSVQLALPNPPPADADAMAKWLQQTLALEKPASRVRSEEERAVPWGDRSVRQPARWLITFATPRVTLQAEYWVGNQSVAVKRGESNLIAMLTNLHKGNAAHVGWVLLVDTLAGSILLLSITGVTLWMLTRRRRAVGVMVIVICFVSMIGFAWQAF